MLKRLIDGLLGSAAYHQVPDGGGVAGAPAGDGGSPSPAPAPAPSADPGSIPQPAGAPQTLNPQVGSTADPDGMADETSEWVVDAFSHMTSPVLDDVIEGPPPAPPAQTPAANQPPTRVGQPPVAPPQAPAATPPTLQPSPYGLPAVEPQATVPQTGVVAPAPQAPEPQAIPPDQVFDQLATQIGANRDALAQHLAQSVYKMSDQELNNAGLTPEQAALFSRKLAEVQVQVTGSIMRLFTQQMPQFVNGLLQRNTRQDEGEKQFWSDNPHLNKTHEQAILEVGRTFRQLNPNASREQFNKFVGDYVGMQFGLVRPVPGAQQPPQAVGPTGHPVASLPPVQTPGRVVRPNGHIPYSPAGSNTAPPGSLPAAPDTEWGRMMNEMMKFDQGQYDR